jgi:hypothetical protein
VLGIQYGLDALSFAVRAGISLSEACEILARLRARFRGFEDYAHSVLDRLPAILDPSAGRKSASHWQLLPLSVHSIRRTKRADIRQVGKSMICATLSCGRIPISRAVL